MSRMDDAAIREAMARAEKATPGPWAVASDLPRYAVFSTTAIGRHGYGKRVVCSGNQNNDTVFVAADWSGADLEDANFIAAVREDFPRVAAEALARGTDAEGLRAEVANAKRRAEDAEAKIARQAEELTTKDATLRQRTIDLDAMAWVWCDGGCKSGVFRYPENAELRPLTREMVARALRNVERMAGKLANLEVKEESERPAIWAASAARAVANERVREAEAEVARLRAAALPEDARVRIAKWLWTNRRDKQNDRSWEEILREAPPDQYPYGCPAFHLEEADGILAAIRGGAS